MFNNFPNIIYSLETEQSQLINDRFFKIDFYYNYIEKNLSLFKEYVINDNTTPEELASFYYQNQKYWFLILLINQRYDPFFDWVLTNDEILNYATKFVTENYLEVQQYISSNPSILTNLNEELNLSLTSYSPSDPTDKDDIIVNHMIGHYFTKLNEENNERRLIYLPESSMMDKIYSKWVELTSKF